MRKSLITFIMCFAISTVGWAGGSADIINATSSEMTVSYRICHTISPTSYREKTCDPVITNHISKLSKIEIPVTTVDGNYDLLQLITATTDHSSSTSKTKISYLDEVEIVNDSALVLNDYGTPTIYGVRAYK